MQKTGFGVKAIIMKKGKFLVLRKPNGELDLPGGRVEDDEKYKDSLHREITEETGLKVKIFDPVARWSFVKTPELLVTGFTYYCQYLSGKIELSHEHCDYFWGDLEETVPFFRYSYFGQNNASQLIDERRASCGRV